MFEAPECVGEFGVDEQGVHGPPVNRRRGCWASTIGKFRPRFPDRNHCGPARCGGLVPHLFSHRAAVKLYKREQVEVSGLNGAGWWGCVFNTSIYPQWACLTPLAHDIIDSMQQLARYRVHFIARSFSARAARAAAAPAA